MRGGPPHLTDCVILIHPPVAKPSEPPAGLAALCGALSEAGVAHTAVDAALEGALWLLERGPHGPADTWTRRAFSHLDGDLACLRDRKGYAGFDRYRKAVSEVNRVLEKSSPAGTRVGLADYGHDSLSPVRSADLLQAALRHEENVFYPYFRARLSPLVEAGGPGALVGFSLNYLSQALCAFAMMGFLRLKFPAVKIAVGGGLVSAWMSSPAWRDPFGGLIDHLVPGPGESFLLSLAGAGASGGGAASVGSAPDGRTCPSFDAFPLDRYLAPGPILPYAAARGCYWGRCSFCPEKSQGATFSARRPGEAAADLSRLSARHRPVLIHLVDNAISPALMRALIASPPPAPWYGFARVTDELGDFDFCRDLRSSGCVMLKLGIESGDQGLLDVLGKGTSAETAAKALAALKRAGIGTYVYLLFGTPSEDLARARKTLAFAVRNSASIDFLNLAIFNLPAGCREARELDLRPFYAGDLSLYSDFVHPSGFGRREVRAFLERELRAHPAIRPIVLRRPPYFTSNHAPLFCLGREPFRDAAR